MTKVSVGMFTYNRPQTLERAARCILDQTLPEIELLLVNNGSADGQVEAICQQLAAEDKRVRYFGVYPNSIPKAYQTILANCRGKYFTQMDDDDYCEPDMLAFLYQLAESQEADIAFCGSYRVIDGKAVPRFQFDNILVMNKEQALRAFLQRDLCSAAVWSKLFKREKVIGRIGWTSYGKQGDAATVYKWFANADKVVAHGVPKYYQVRTESDDLQGYIGRHNLSPALLENYLAIFAERTRYLAEKAPGIADCARYSEWSFMISMCDNIAEYQLLERCAGQYQRMVATLRANQEELVKSGYLTEREKRILREREIIKGV